MKRHRPTPRTSGWSQSAQFRQIGRDAIRDWNAKRTAMPRCGAKRKSDGGHCQQWPMDNGRCYVHGGRTPRGAHWHRPRWSASADKTNRKLLDRERQGRKRAARVAAMTADERVAYLAWQRTHRPGAAGSRASARAQRRRDREAATLLASRRAPPGDAAAIDALTTEIEALRREAARISSGIEPSNATQGVFE
jgi:hypothetical protein